VASIFYDVIIMGFRVRIVPNKITIYDDNNEIKGNTIPDNIVRYCIAEGYCDAWATKESYNIRVEIMRIKK